MLKGILPQRHDLKVIVMSASIESKKFQEFFGGAPLLSIPGRSFPVKITHLVDKTDDYITAAINLVKDINTSDQEGDILVFVPGKEEINDLYGELITEIRCNLKFKGLTIFKKNSSIGRDQENRVLAPTPQEQRKCIISTYYAESSIALPGVRFAVDSGLQKVNSFNTDLKMESLDVVPISKASAMQRAGRAGRTSPGYCYRLYTEPTYKLLEPVPTPEFLTSDISLTLLSLKSLGIDIETFPFPDRPRPSSIKSAIESLMLLNALDSQGNVTTFGHMMTRFPVPPTHAAMIVKAADHNCVHEFLLLVSMLSLDRVFYMPDDITSQHRVKQERENFAVPGFEHLTYVKLLSEFLSLVRTGGCQVEKFCDQYGIDKCGMLEALNLYNQLKDIATNVGLAINTPMDLGGFECEVTKKVLISVGPDRIAYLKDRRYYLLTND